MTVYSVNSPEPEYGMLLPVETISLTEADINWARQQSQTSSNQTTPWQIYLNALARIGLQYWLEKRSPELLESVNHYPAVSADQLCEVTVGSYRLYLVATDTVDDAEVALSDAAIVTQFNPHYYVLVEVFEEIQQVHICGYLSQSQLVQLQLQPASDALHWLPVTAFDLNIERLLLCLTCLEPEALAIPRTATTPLAAAAAMAINVGRWLQNQIDQAAEDLAWVLLPPIPATRETRSAYAPFLSQSGELRPLQSPTEEFNRLIADLIRSSNLTIPPQTRGAYRDWQWEGIDLRLYVATWEVPLAGSPDNWALLLVLAAQPGATLPLGIQLQVRDAREVLEEPVLTDTSSVYLYAQVTGDLDEQFWVTISLPSGATTTLAPFTFSNS